MSNQAEDDLAENLKKEGARDGSWQRGSITKHRGRFRAQWRENGHHKSLILGPKSMTMTEARKKLQEIIDRVNKRDDHVVYTEEIFGTKRDLDRKSEDNQQAS